jgi:hypothetical protein
MKHLNKKIEQQNIMKKNALYWAFYCVNDVKDVEGGSLQIMKCIFVIIVM